MLNKDESFVNKDEHSEPVLNTQNAFQAPLWKKVFFASFGTAGLMIISLITALIVYFINQQEDDAKTVLITYSILFAVMFTIAAFDIPKLKNDFKKYQSYVYGGLMGFAILGVTMSYTGIVNLFYQFNINENELSAQNIINTYPVASIFIIGMAGPICEELTYRVGIFSLLNKVNKYLAFAVTTVVFAFAHFDISSTHIADEFINLPAYLASGFMLTFAYYKLGFVGSMSAHITNNLIAVITSITPFYLR